MPKEVKKAEGSGITAVERTYLNFDLTAEDDKASFIDAHREMYRKMHRHWSFHSKNIAQIRERLVSAKDRAEQAGLDWSSLLKRNETEEWYLHEIDVLSRIVEGAVERGHVWEAIGRAMMIGSLISESRMKFAWEGFALAGQKHQEASQQNAKDRRKQTPQERYERVKSFRLKGHSWERSYGLAAKHFGIAASTVKQDCLPIKKLDNTID